MTDRLVEEVVAEMRGRAVRESSILTAAIWTEAADLVEARLAELDAPGPENARVCEHGRRHPGHYWRHACPCCGCALDVGSHCGTCMREGEDVVVTPAASLSTDYTTSSPAVSFGDAPGPEEVARCFHENYERLAPIWGYKTRDESAVPWEDVPEQNRKLMIDTAAAVLTSFPLAASPSTEGLTEEEIRALVQCVGNNLTIDFEDEWPELISGYDKLRRLSGEPSR